MLAREDFMVIEDVLVLRPGMAIELYRAVYGGKDVSCPFCAQGLIRISGKHRIMSAKRHIGITYRFVCRHCKKEFFGDHIWYDAP